MITITSSRPSLYLLLCTYVVFHRLAHAQTVSLFDPLFNDTLASIKLDRGDFEVGAFYQVSHDIPEQREALERLYQYTGGQFWSSIYSNTAGLTAYNALEAGLPQTGVVYINTSQFMSIYGLQIPWFTPGWSYCHWAGITCCLTAGSRVLRTCGSGFSSVGSIVLPDANMSGTLPVDLFERLPDLAVMAVPNNEGLTGQIVNVPQSIAADMCIMQLQETSLQISCATPGPGGNTATYSENCYSNLFAVDGTRRRTVSGQLGMWCPDIAFSRFQQNLSSGASTVCDLNADPLLTCYYGCRCTHPLQPYYYIDSAGLFQMSCTRHDKVSAATIAIPVVLAVALCYGSWVLFAYWPRLKREWLTFRNDALKRRHAPGTLMDSPLARGSDVFQRGMCLVMTDVEGSTALWEWNGHVMNIALGLHDYTLRSLLPKHYGSEVTTEGDAFILAFHDPLDAVSWALQVQLTLLDAPWPPEVFQHPLGKPVSGSDGKLLFRGLRVRMAIHTGIPDEIIVHNVTKQVEYRGELVQLTEALSHLPTGGQVLLSDPTFKLVAHRLHDLRLPAVSASTTEHSAKSNRLKLASSVSVKSITGLLRGISTSSLSSTAKKSRQAFSRIPWPRKRRSSGSVHSAPSPQASGNVCIEVSSELARVADTTATQAAKASKKADTMAATLLDMGYYLLAECRNRPYTAEDAANPPIAGEHVVQILPQDLLGRAALFPAMDPAAQVAPSFFDAPAARAVGLGGVRRAHSASLNVPAFLASPKNPLPSLAFAFGSNAQQQMHLLPGITYAAVSTPNFKEVMQLDEQVGLIALGRFKSCVRTTLLLCQGYECQEGKSSISAAFASPCHALEWAVTLQLALLRLPWGEALLALEPAQEELHLTQDQLLTAGLAASIGLAQDPVQSISPGLLTGRATYSGSCVNRAVRLCALCNGGQILMEQSLVEAVQQEWGGQAVSNLSAAGPSQIARRNYELLLHRKATAMAASELTCSTSTLSAIVGRTLSQAGRRISTWPSSIPKLMRHQSMDSGLLTAFRDRTADDGLKPAGSSPSSSKPRRASMPVMPKRRLSSLWTRDSPPPDANAARRYSNRDDFKFAGIPLAMPEMPFAMPQAAKGARRRHDVFLPSTLPESEPTEEPELEPGADIPCTSVAIEVYRAGLYSYRGTREKYDLCQVYPASLSERRNLYDDLGNAPGSHTTCLHKDDALLLHVDVLLPDIVDLPLAAEPPLYINMTTQE